MKKEMEEKHTEKVSVMTEYGKNKLLTYAESFRELARSLDEEFEWDRHREGMMSVITLKRSGIV